MHDPSTGREMRRFWAINEDAFNIQRVLGYATQDDSCWWCPAMGYSGYLGSQLHDEYEKAKDMMRALIAFKEARLRDALYRIDHDTIILPAFRRPRHKPWRFKYEMKPNDNDVLMLKLLSNSTPPTPQDYATILMIEKENVVEGENAGAPNTESES